MSKFFRYFNQDLPRSRIPDRFCIRAGKFRLHVSGSFDNRHIANQGYPRNLCQGLAIYRDVAEHRRINSQNFDLGCYSRSILHRAAVNTEGDYSITL